jgi:ATP-dependent protease ClpP protease subunit
MTPTPQPICWRFENVATAAPELYVEDEIGGWGKSVTDFRTELSKVTAPRLTLHIHSQGGSIFDAFAMYDMLKAHPARVTSVITLAASAASVVALAADRVEITPQGQIMIHNTSIAQVAGNADDLHSVASQLQTFDKMIAGVYVAKAGGSAEHWQQLMAAETWFRAQQAVDAGLVDAVVAADHRLAPAASLTRQMAAYVRETAVQREVDRQLVPLLAARAVRGEIAARAAVATIRDVLASLPLRRTSRRRRRPNIYGA